MNGLPRRCGKETARQIFGEWKDIIGKKNSKNSFRRFARYIAFKEAVVGKEEQARIEIEKLERKKRKKKRNREPSPEMKQDVINCPCGANFDDKESLFVCCDSCQCW